MKSEVPENIAFDAKTNASSFYNLKKRDNDYQHKPSFATDNNNAKGPSQSGASQD